MAMLMRLDEMCFCKLLSKLRDLRRSINDPEEDPIVPGAPTERFINFICL